MWIFFILIKPVLVWMVAANLHKLGNVFQVKKRKKQEKLQRAA